MTQEVNCFWVQEDKKFEVRCSTPAYFKPGYVQAEKRRRSKAAATAKLAEFCIVAQGSRPKRPTVSCILPIAFE